MWCRSVKRQLFDYSDHALAPKTMHELSRHVDQCPACAGELETVTALKAALRREAEPLAPESLWASIKAEIADTVQERESLWFRIKDTLAQIRILRTSWLPALATAIFLFVVMLDNSLVPYRYRDLNDYLNDQVNAVYYLNAQPDQRIRKEGGVNGQTLESSLQYLLY